MGWRDIACDPTSAAALDARRAELTNAWRSFDATRNDVLAALCGGRKVLDIGCVDAGAREVGVLHPALVDAASACVGIDNDAEGVGALAACGARVIFADVTAEPSTELLAAAPFDRIVAGDVIEHLSAPVDLLRFASQLLAADGVLLVTTPNPYALHRVRSGWAHVIWENVDHVTYVFPSGMAELAARTGMHVDFYGTCRTPGWEGALNARASTRRYFAAKRHHVALPPWYVPPYVPWLRPRDAAMLRETMIYGIAQHSPGAQ